MDAVDNEDIIHEEPIFKEDYIEKNNNGNVESIGNMPEPETPISFDGSKEQTNKETESATIDTTNADGIEQQAETEVVSLLLEKNCNVQAESNALNETEICRETKDDVNKVTNVLLSKKETCETSEKSRTNISTSQQNDDLYYLKWFEWKGVQTPIVTQNENGPCPLLAIANVLILARKFVLPEMQQFITATQLIEYIGDCLHREAEKQKGSEELLLNYAQNMQDAMDIMHKLQTGIDVNVKFGGVSDFEFTRECIVFDLLQIVLYHGWLVEPQDESTLKAVNGLSYNQLVEKMLTDRDDDDSNKVAQSYEIEEFLNRTATQLTYHGLCELNSTIEEEELCVFFRNNHFSTLYKHKKELFILVTDQGYLNEPNVVWETLVNIDGAGQFVNSNFKTVVLQSDRVMPPRRPTPPDPTPTLTQEDRDYLIALQMQENDAEDNTCDVTPKHSLDSDHALALRLQAEEEHQARRFQQEQDEHERVSAQTRARPPTQPTTPVEENKSRCSIC